MKRLIVCCASVSFAIAVQSADLDLADGDKSVTTLAGYDNVVNSGSEARTLTVTLDTANETFAGTISGNVKLVKAGKKILELTAANTYTGGTEINAGIVKVSNVTSLGAKTGKVYVNSDCTAKAKPTEADICAIAVNAKTFDYNVEFAEWANDSRPTFNGDEGHKSLYNFWTCYEAGGIVINGKLTGGDISIRVATNVWGSIGKLLTQSVTYKGEISCRNLYIASRAMKNHAYGKLAVTSILLSNAGTPTTLYLYNSANQIGSIDVGRYASGGGVFANGENALGGAVLYSSATRTSQTAQFDLSGYSQKINRPMMTVDTAGIVLNTGCKGIDPYISNNSDCRHVIVNSVTTNNITLTMNATQSCTNDWLFAGKMDLVWNPTGDYTITNVYRCQTVQGKINVRRGTFAVGADCTFSNVTDIIVGQNATFALADVAALKSGVVNVEIATDGKVRIPDGQTVSFVQFKYGDSYVPIGTHSDGQFGIEGGSVEVRSCPTEIRTSVWTGKGATAELTDAENWKDSANPPGLTSSGDILSFAEDGTNAVVASEALVAGMIFNATNGFTIGGESTVRVYGEGVECPPTESVDVERTFTVNPPIKIEVPQTWMVATNATLRVAGGILSDSQTSLELRGYGNVEFVANENSDSNVDLAFGADDYPWDDNPGTGKNRKLVCPKVTMTGENPIGKDGSITITGTPSRDYGSGTEPHLYLNNADISNPIVLKGHYQTYFVSLWGTTNTIRSAFNTSQVDFAPYFYVHPHSSLTMVNKLDFTMSKTRYDGLVWTVLSSSDSVCDELLVMNGAVNYPYDLAIGSRFGNIWFNASSNTLRSIKADWSVTINCGADYAFANGVTAFNSSTNSLAKDKRTATLDIHGHPQHLGAIGPGNQWTQILSSEKGAELRFNQTNNVVYAGTIGANVTLVKEGAAMFTTGSVGTNVRVEAGTLAFSTNGVCQYKTTVLTVGPNGKVHLPEGETRVKQLLYWNGSAYVYAKRGVYDKSHGTLGSLFDGNSVGTLRVRQDENPPGLAIFIN